MAKKSSKNETGRLDEIGDTLRVPADGKFKLKSIDPDSTPGGPDKDAAAEMLKELHRRLNELQEILYAEAKHAVLVVLQALDTGGKDGIIRRVFGPMNPQGVSVTSFKQPTAEELAHDYLWRIHRAVPPKGLIGIFNRSHYEDVLVVRVHKLVSEAVIKERYEQINAFEKHLCDNGVTILKFFLHISRGEQQERLQDRLDRADKHWKFSSGDLAERERWDSYMETYERCLRRCSPPWAPWHVIPANRKWYRDIAVAGIVLSALDGLKLRYPDPEPGLDQLVIPD